MVAQGFQPRFKIADRWVGGDAPCLFIAEAGVAHFGDMDLAVQLVDLAASAGADVFKTQMFDVEALFASSLPEWRERLRPRNLSLEEFQEIKRRCDAKDLLFMATAHDETRIPWLRELKVPAIKVGSGERRNPRFLTALANLGRPMIVSTGMYNEAEVALLHCVTSYPTPDDDVNLAAMSRLAEIFEGPVGYSDHTPDFLALLSAVARGAKVVEKHITIHRDIPNAQDWKVSAGPEDFPALVADIRRIETLLGHGRKEAAPSETAGMAWALKSVVAANDLVAGQTLAASDLTAKRPGSGVPASRLSEFVGRRLRHGVPADTALSFEDLE